MFRPGQSEKSSGKWQIFTRWYENQFYSSLMARTAKSFCTILILKPLKKGAKFASAGCNFVILITITKPWLSIHIFLVLNIIFLQIWLKNWTQGDVHWDMDGLCSNAQIVNQAHSFLLFKTRSWNELFWQWVIKVWNYFEVQNRALKFFN